MSNYIRVRSETGRTPSPKIFGDLGKIQHDAFVGKCIYLFDDFAYPTIHASASASGGYFTIQDTNVTIQGQNTAPDLATELGVLELATNAADNAEGYIAFGWGNQWKIDNSAGNTGKVGFEARIQSNTVGDNGLAFFAGLMQGPVAANYLLDNSGEVHASRGVVGFQRLQDDGDKIDTFYKEGSQTKQTVLANAATIVVDTYINLGLIYHPNSPDANQIRFFVDGVESNTYVTRTNMDAATFPEGTGLQPIILVKNGGAVATKLKVDWVASYQYENEL